MSKESISIILPVFNQGKILAETLESIIAQTHYNWECIVVDDGSHRNTLSVINYYCIRDQRIKFYKRPKGRKKGANACRNFGFEKSQNEFIQWFDADDVMHPEMLEQKVEKFKGQDLHFVLCEGIEFSGSISNTSYRWKQVKSRNPLLDHALGKINFHTNGPMFKRSFLENKPLFDESLQRKQEWEFYTRLLTFSPRYGIIQKPLFFYRIHENSINGSNSLKTLKSRMRADKLVFSTLKSKEELFSFHNIPLRKHFYFATWNKIKLAFITFRVQEIFYGFSVLFTYFSFRFVTMGCMKIIRNPQILKNMVNK